MTTDLHNNTSVAEPRPAVDEDIVFELLAAYQFLQGQNVQMASELSTRLDVGPTDLRVLMFIHRSENVTPKDVATQLKMTSGSVTALLDRLEHSGHLLRRPHPSDRRSLTLLLTESGAAVVAAVRGAYRSAFTGVFDCEQIAQVASALRTLGNCLDRAIRSDTVAAHSNRGA